MQRRARHARDRRRLPDRHASPAHQRDPEIDTLRASVEQQPPTGKEDKGVKVFKGESEIINELSFLSQDRKKRKVYFLQGDGELDINNPEDDLRQDLRKDLNGYGCGIIVEGLKMIKRHTKKNQNNPNGAIVEREGTIHISNVMRAETFDARAAKRGV